MSTPATHIAARDLELVSARHSFLEGPRWHDGALWASDFFTNRVLRFAQDGAVTTICELPGRPSGLGWTPEGELLVSVMLERRVVRIDRDGQVQTVADLSGHAPWHINDMVVDAEGRCYVGNFGWDDESDDKIVPTCLHRVDPDGSVHVAAIDVVFPNGMAISPDGRTLYVAETFASRISAFDRQPDGTLGNRRTWATWLDYVPESIGEVLHAGVPLPDGIALDADGALWVGDARAPVARRVAEGGEVLSTVQCGDQAPYAVCLGGADRRTLYLCLAVPYRLGDPAGVHTARLMRTRAVSGGVGRP